MYSRRVIQRRLEAASRIGVRLAVRSLDFTAKMAEVLGPVPRLLSPDEQEYIQSEIILCQCDFLYWASRYAVITHWRGYPILFVPNKAQSIILDVWSEMEDEGLPLNILELKGRQSGVSTLTELAIAHRVQFYPNVHAVIGSSDPEKSRKMAAIIENVWKNAPWWLLPKMTKHVSGELIEFGEQESSVSIEHGRQLTGIARGTTVSIVHLCLSPHSLVIVGDGMAKPIAEVKAGDRVITSTGRVALVSRVLKSARTNELTTELWLWGNFAPLSCTRDHPIMCPDGWRPASSLKSGDWVKMPVRKITQELREVHTQVLPHARTHKYGVTKTFQLDFDFGWLCGLYLAEGCMQTTKRNGKVWVTGLLFAIHQKEVEEFSAKLQSSVGQNQPIKVKKHNSQTRVLAVGSAQTARWMEENFGHRDQKRVPDWCWSAGRDFCKGIIAGYLKGDGHLSKTENQIFASSVRLQLHVQLRSLIASLGYGWSGICQRPAGNYYNRNCREIWILTIANPTAARLRQDLEWPVESENHEALHWRYTPNRDFIEIQVERNFDGFSPEFYDLEVAAEEHDFCTLQCCVKNSEIPDFDDPEEKIDSSLLRAVHDTPETFIVLESTAKGRGPDNYWHKKWLTAKEGWRKRRSRFRPVFLPFFVAEDLWPTEDWLKLSPIPRNWQPELQTANYAHKAALYVASVPLLRKHLGANWEMSHKQKWFWECERAEAVRNHTLNKLLEELPADDLEAFQSGTISVFDGDLLSRMRASVMPPAGVYSVFGDLSEIPVRFHPDRPEVDRRREQIRVRYTSGGEAPPSDYVLYPLHSTPEDDPDLRFYVYERPAANEEYVIGVDIGDGIGADRSVIQVIRRGDEERNDMQVAEFASAWVSGHDLWPFLLAIGAYYTIQMGDKQVRPKLVIEVNRGESVQFEIRKRGWSNCHVRRKLDRRSMTVGTALGWLTTQNSRTDMLDFLGKSLRDRWFDINSPWFIDEMADFGQNDLRRRLEALHGAHDDRLFAAGIGLFSLHINEIRGTRPLSWTEREKARTTTYPVYQPGLQAQAWSPSSDPYGMVTSELEEYDADS